MENKLLRFLDFVNEANIRNIKGIPSEKLDDIDREGSLIQRQYRGGPGPLFGQIMRLMDQSKRFTIGKEKELEKLANEIILNEFSGLQDFIDLNLKLVGDGHEVKKFMDEEDEDEEEDNDEQEEQEERELSEEEVLNAVSKRKIINNIIQGNAINTKDILHSEFAKSGLRKLYGADFDTIFNIWDNISKIATKLDWIVPIDAKADMMENQPAGMAGACAVKFPKDKDKKEKEDKQDIPEVKAVGIDFPMLLHEAVKGIYEALSDIGMPSDMTLAKEVHKQTSTFRDEAEDFRYGPELAADLRDFINLNKKVDKYPNIREYVYSKLIDSNRWSDEECLLNLKNIFMESPEAIKLIDMLIDEVISELDEYYSELKDYEEKLKYSEEKPTFDFDSLVNPKEKDSKEEDEILDYSKLSKREINKMIDDALDANDFARVGELSKYIKEAKHFQKKNLR